MKTVIFSVPPKLARRVEKFLSACTAIVKVARHDATILAMEIGKTRRDIKIIKQYSVVVKNSVAANRLIKDLYGTGLIHEGRMWMIVTVDGDDLARRTSRMRQQ